MRIDDRIQLIRELVAFEGRWAGTDAERRAANFLAGRLRGLGRSADIQPIYVRPEYSLAIALYCALAIAGSLVAVEAAPAGLALCAIALFALLGDLTTLLRAGRFVFFRRASQNVLSPGRRPDAPARLVLVAHYDAARTGYVFSPKRARRAARLHERFRIGPFTVPFWSVVVLAATLVGRFAGLDGTWLSVVQFVPTAVLLITVVLLIDIALSAVVPGANDNASGVATAVSLAEELDSDPPHNLDVWVLLTGAEEALMEGMAAFLAGGDGRLDRRTTYFVSIDSVGAGHVRYAIDEGFVVPLRYDGRLVSLCEAIAAADGEGRFGATPARLRFGTDAFPARIRGFPAIAIGCTLEDGYIPGYHTSSDTTDRLEPEAIERAHDFVLELVRLLDRDLERERPPDA